jgi:SNF2 family DNA or RNA helicase
VHRIGQKQKTFVHSFIVSNSIEENVFKLNRERAAGLSNSLGKKSTNPTKDEEQLTTR